MSFLKLILIFLLIFGAPFAYAQDHLESDQPCKEELIVTKWSADLVVQFIQLLQFRGIDVNAASLRKINAEKIKSLIFTELHFESTGLALYKAGRRFYKSWDDALKAAGLDFRESRDLPKWDKDIILVIIQEIAAAQHPIHYFSMRTSEDPIIETTLKKHLKKDIDGNSLVAAAARYWGGWDQALTAAGFDPQSVRPQMSWDKDLVTKALAALHERGVEINTHALSRDKSAETTEILKEITGQEVTGVALFDRAVSYFEAYDAALRAAGIDPEKVRKREETAEWSKEKVLQVIQALKAANVLLNYEAIANNESDIFQKITENIFGKKVSGLALIGAAGQYFGGWEPVLKKAGLDPTSVRIQLKWKKKKPALLKLIRELHAQKIALNYKNIEKMQAAHPQLSAATTQWLGKPVSGIAILYAAKKAFGGWSKAIEAARIYSETPPAKVAPAPAIERMPTVELLPELEPTSTVSAMEEFIEFAESNLLFLLDSEKKESILENLVKQHSEAFAGLSNKQRKALQHFCLFSNKSIAEIQANFDAFVVGALRAVSL